MIVLQVLQQNTLLLVVNGFVAVALAISGIIAFLAVGRGGIPEDAGLPPDPAQTAANWSIGLFPKSWFVYLASLAAIPLIVGLICVESQCVTLDARTCCSRQVHQRRNDQPDLCGTFLKDISTPTGLILLVTGVGRIGVPVYRGACVPSKIERERLYVAIILMFFSLLFWAFFEQAGSSINNFTDRNVDRVFGERVITQDEVGKTIHARHEPGAVGLQQRRRDDQPDACWTQARKEKKTYGAVEG